MAKLAELECERRIYDENHNALDLTSAVPSAVHKNVRMPSSSGEPWILDDIVKMA